MPPTMVGAGTALLVLIGIATPLSGQSRPAPWRDYDLNQFITMSRGSPSSILGLDDNGRLVLAAAGGIAEAELLGVEGASDSQLTLLETWQLLDRDGDTLRTSFPILDAAGTRHLRAATRAAAVPLADAIAADVEHLRDELNRRGRADNAYSILFSYVLDGLTWDLWEATGTIPVRELSVEHPFWAGEVWAVTPARSGLVGTNRVSDERGALNITWSYAALPSMVPFVADFVSVEALFEHFADRRDVVSPEVRAVFEPHGLFDERGSLTIPIVEAHVGDPVYDLAIRIATTLTAEAPGALDLPGLRQRFGFDSDAQALIVAYHELMWDTLEALVRRGLVSRPAVLDGAGGGPADVAALIFGAR
jgi:hypothetical protein